jgi:site-specific recombinase XerD
VRVVRKLTEHCGKSPDQITEEELRHYFLYLKNVKQFLRSAPTVALCGIKFSYENTLRREWTTLNFVRPTQEHKLPVILSSEEVARALGSLRIIESYPGHCTPTRRCIVMQRQASTSQP